MTYAATEHGFANGSGSARSRARWPWIVWLGSLAIGGWYKDAEGTLRRGRSPRVLSRGPAHRRGTAIGPLQLRPDSEGRLPDSIIGWPTGTALKLPQPALLRASVPPHHRPLVLHEFPIWTAISFALLGLSIILLRPARPVRAFLWALASTRCSPRSASARTRSSAWRSSQAFTDSSNDRRFAAGLVAGLLWFKPQLLIGLFIWWAFSPAR